MALSLHTDYALRTLMYLASRPGRASVARIARFYKISEHHLAKVVQTLVRQKLVRSMRGAGGGIQLALPPEEIRLGQVIEQLEGTLDLLECVHADGVCVIERGCLLRDVLRQATRVQLEYLNRFTLADVLPRREVLVELASGETERLSPSPPERGPSP